VSEAMDEAIESIVDGTPVDWSSVDACAVAERDGSWAKDLRIIHNVANFYRLSAFEPPLSNKTRSVADRADEEPTVEVVVGEEQAARYQAGLRHLARDERHAVIGRLELLSSYHDLAAVLGFQYRSTRVAAIAARKAVARALKRLTIEMGHV
jgi:DNA-directed RNA polymerase specialized sigma24 family protein